MTDSTLSEALVEAYASAPTDEIVYHTLEINHPDFTQPIRVVRGWDALTAGGHDWVPLPFDLSQPDAASATVPRLTVQLDNVGPEMIDPMELAAASSAPTTVVYRAFLSSDLSAEMTSQEFTLVNIVATATTVTAQAALADLANKKFPREVYRDDTFPGLVP